jgi:hypothetical protein
MLAFADVTASVAHFVSFEVLNLIETPSRVGFLATGWPGAVIAVLGMEMVIYVAVEAGRTMKPRASADEDATGKPLWAVVAVGSAFVRRSVIVAVGTFRRNADIDLYLSLCFGSGYHETDCSDSSERKQLKSVHSIILAILISEHRDF